MRRTIDGAFEIVIDARPYGPPLTPAEHLLQTALVTAFVFLLGAEVWILWHLWSLWG